MQKRLSKEDFDKNVKHYVNVHRGLHGKYTKWEDIHADFLKSFPEEEPFEVMLEIEKQSTKMDADEKQYGIFIGRAQPFTNAHNEIIQSIIRDGKTPIIIIGSIDKNDDRNPLTFEERKSLIKKVYPFGCRFIGLDDKDDWNYWYEMVKTNLEKIAPIKQMTLYSHSKPEDVYDTFEFKGIIYNKCHYTEIFRMEGFGVKDFDEVTCFLGNVIHASDVRKDEEIAKRNLDARIYRVLKDKIGWWK